MSSILTIEGAQLQLGTHPLFTNLSFGITSGSRTALVGSNGAGKTTLLRVLAGHQGLDSGRLVRRGDLTTGYLPQEVEAPPEPLLQDYVRSSRLGAVELRLKEVETLLQTTTTKELLNEYGDLQQRYAYLGGYEQEESIAHIIEAFDLMPWCRSPMGIVSPGVRHRAALARELLDRPDLLLLDEPTNHLDQAAIQGLETLLTDYPGAIVFTSHDRVFLNRVATHLAWLEQGELESFTGNYDDFLVARSEAKERALKAEESRKDEVKALQKTIEGAQQTQRISRPSSDRNKLSFNARGERRNENLSRTSRQAQARMEALEAEKKAIPRERSFSGIRFQMEPIESPCAVELQDVSFGFEDRPLFSSFNLTVARKERLFLEGANGVGKSTLLRLVCRELLPQDGSMWLAPQAVVGLLPQEPARPSGKVSKWFASEFGIDTEQLRKLVIQIGFRSTQVIDQLWSSLSVGQSKTLWLLALILRKPNLLLLDEPTNHLDLDLLEHFEEALLHSEMTVIAISHDRRFIERIATKTLNLDSLHRP